MVDVIVIGGGPAGAVAAARLAGWGRAVQLITRDQPARHDLAESLPPSVVERLRRLGFSRALETVPAHPYGGNTVWWEDVVPRSEKFPDGQQGLQVLRSDLEHALVAAVEAAGVSIFHGRVQHVGNEEGQPVVQTDRTGVASAHAAHAVLDCSGRAGVLGRDYRSAQTKPRMLALIGMWGRPDAWPVPDQTHTLIESYQDGWVWSVPVTGAGYNRQVTVMLDPERTAVGNARDALSMYESELDKVRAFRDLLEPATRVGDVVAVDASPHCCDTASGPWFSLAGDAASFIDPLSSFGVKKAVASACVASAVVNTRFERPELFDEACALHTAIERRMYRSAERAATKFFASTAQAASPFWADRVALPEHTDDPAGEDEVDRLRTDPEVLEAFDRIRQADTLRVSRSETKTIGRAVIGERHVEHAPHLVNQACPAGIRYLRGVVLPDLAEVACRVNSVPDAYEQYQSRNMPVILPDFLGALAVLVGKGFLRLD